MCWRVSMHTHYILSCSSSDDPPSWRACTQGIEKGKGLFPDSRRRDKQRTSKLQQPEQKREKKKKKEDARDPPPLM